MTQQKKDLARKSLVTASKKEIKPSRFKTEFIGVMENEKGNYFYAVVGVDLIIKTETGSILINKDIQIPISMKDIDTIEPGKPKKEIPKETTKPAAPLLK